ncbi:MAG: HDOD domain-containing protein [Pseudomonadota bacterium]
MFGSWINRLLGRERTVATHSPRPDGANATALPPMESPAAHRDPERDHFLAQLGADTLQDSTAARPLVEKLRALAEEETLARHIPRLPTLVPRLLQALRDPTRSTADYVALIRDDPAAIAEILRVANSALYNRGTPLQGIEQAVARLGTDGLRETVSRLAFRPVMRRDANQALTPSWRLIAKTSAAAAALATATGGARFEAWLGGLAFHTGALVAAKALPVTAPPPTRALFEARHVLLPKIARKVAQEWEFPSAVVQALDAQDKPNGASLGAIVQAAHRLALVHSLIESGRYEAHEREADWLAGSALSPLADKAWAALDQVDETD